MRDGPGFIGPRGGLGRRVAVKRLHEGCCTISMAPSSVHSRFYREAQLPLSQHPCIVPIYRLSHGERGELSYSMKLILAMPWAICGHH